MYVYIYVFIDVSMYVCMYVFMYAYMYLGRYGYCEMCTHWYMYVHVYMRACTFLGQAKGIGEMDTRMEAGGRQAACREALSSCPSVASSPGSELAPPVPTMSRKHQQHRHPHDAQRDVVQHAPSPATSPLGRRVHASRKHPAEKTPCSSTPIQSAKLVQAAHQQRV